MTTSGSVQSIRRGQLSIINENGNKQTFLIQQEKLGAIAVGGGKAIIRAPATIKVTGTMPASVLRPGCIIKTVIQVTRTGRCQEPIKSIEMMELNSALQVSELTKPSSTGESFDAEVTARILKCTDSSIQIEIPANEIITKSKFSIPLHGDVEIAVSYDTLNFVRAGDIVQTCAAGKLSTGDLLIGEIDIELLPRKELISTSLDERLEYQFAHLSDQAYSKPRDERLDHFLLHTDVSDRKAKILQVKLDNLLNHVSEYYQTSLDGIVECFIVENLEHWPNNAFDSETTNVLNAKEGVTITAIRGNDRKSVVYSHANDSIVQHQAVHAYLGQTFGSSGPYWYSNGMAELARYWKKEIRHVSVHPVIIEFLRNGEQLKLEQLITDRKVIALGWQDDAWRWAVCHFLANNPNYSKRFKQLGINLLTGRRNDSFAKAYGEQENQLRFEFRFFMSHLQNGLRADLIAWNWSHRSKLISGSRKTKSKIRANLGWQPTGAVLESGKSYTIKTEGTWATSNEGKQIDANGEPDGQGKLVGVIFKDFELSEPFELGPDNVVEAPGNGQLFLRCNDDWSELDDNSGQIEVEIQLKKNQSRNQLQ